MNLNNKYHEFYREPTDRIQLFRNISGGTLKEKEKKFEKSGISIQNRFMVKKLHMARCFGKNLDLTCGSGFLKRVAACEVGGEGHLDPEWI